MQRIFLIGKKGQLGWELQRTLLSLGDVVALEFPEIDLGKPESLRAIIRNIAPQLIVNAAAYTNVDKAESEPELAMAVNAIAPGVIAQEAERIGAVLIHYSTDYVFDGKKGTAYVEDDATNPINIYGQTKLEGERLIQEVGGKFLIFRTSWLYSYQHGGFVNKVLQWARTQLTLRIVDDQISSPTWARILAQATAQVIAQGRMDSIEYLQKKAGIYHLSGGGSVNRFEWSKTIIELDPKKEEQILKEILPAKSKDFSLVAKRPMFTPLDCGQVEKKLGIKTVDWKLALQMMFENPEVK